MELYVVKRAGTGADDGAVRASTSAAVEQPAADSCQSLFYALDGRHLVVLGKRWHVEVFSVVELAGRRFIQLSIDGPAHYMLTLRLTPHTPVSRLIPAVLDWLAHPVSSGAVIDVV
jgi:hypothetical protein